MPQITIKRPKGYQGLGPNKIECLPASEIVSVLTSELNNNPEANELYIECDNINIPWWSGPGGNDYLEFPNLPQNCAQITKLSLKVEGLMGDVVGWLFRAMPNLETLQLIDTHLQNIYDLYLGGRELRISDGQLPNFKTLILNNVKIITSTLNKILSNTNGTLKYVTLKIKKEDLEQLTIDSRWNSQQQHNPAALEHGIGRLPRFPSLMELDLSQELLNIILRSQMEKITKRQLHDAVKNISRKIIADFVNLFLCFKNARKLPKEELGSVSLPAETQLIGIKVPYEITSNIMSYLYDKNSAAFNLTFPKVTSADNPIDRHLKKLKI